MYLQHSDKICINHEKIDDKQLAALCNFGSIQQRQNISQIQLVGNQFASVDPLVSVFPNLSILNLSDNPLKHFKALKQLIKL